MKGRLATLLMPEGSQAVCVKHFDPLWAGDGVRAWSEISFGLAEWVRARAEIAALTDVVVPLEVGADFILRPFLAFGVATSDMTEDAVRAPAELAVLRSKAAQALESAPSSGERGRIIDAVARRSLIEPSNNTFWEPHESKFVLAEPKVEPADLRAWIAAS